MKYLNVIIRKNNGTDKVLEEVKVKVVDSVAQLDEQFYLDKYKEDLMFCSKKFIILRDYKG